MGFYPIFLSLENRRCVVIGGGSVGERKVTGLVQAGAAVKVIAPELTAKLDAWFNEGLIDYCGREYREGDLAGFELAFVAINDMAVASAVHAEAKRRGVWLNTADDPDHCDFILPSVMRRGDLAVAIGTGGRSPALASLIREELEAYFSAEYGALVRAVADVRQELKKSGLPNGGAWRDALDGEFRRLVNEGKEKEAKDLLLERLTR